MSFAWRLFAGHSSNKMGSRKPHPERPNHQTMRAAWRVCCLCALKKVGNELLFSLQPTKTQTSILGANTDNRARDLPRCWLAKRAKKHRWAGDFPRSLLFTGSIWQRGHANLSFQQGNMCCGGFRDVPFLSLECVSSLGSYVSYQAPRRLSRILNGRLAGCFETASRSPKQFGIS